jgi:hypothetical protein
VKTTQPSWYYVRPNQDILDVNQSEDVVVLMVETENKYVLRFLILLGVVVNKVSIDLSGDF